MSHGGSTDPFLRPSFSSPRVGALMSSREGGQGTAPFDSFNLRPGIGDRDADVAANRARWRQALGVAPVRVDQVHGCRVARIEAAQAADDTRGLQQADASFTTAPGVACEIQVADCLPVLLADRAGRGVAAAHAGWRGLAGGVLDATVAALCDACQCQPAALQAWLGPCIGPQAFEVGDEVRAAFLQPAFDPAAPGRSACAAWFRPGKAPGKWWADLPGLARTRLAHLGVADLQGNDGSPDWCTFSNPSRFFSFRRQPLTGRMAAAIWLRDPV
jgi:polyphenol oxidase